MAKKTRRPAPNPKPSGTWPVVLVAAAAAGRTDGGAGMKHLLEEAGFAEKPAMTVIVKRPRPAPSERGRIVDPYVDDVLDALRALCA
jgi:hypothetical protein